MVRLGTLYPTSRFSPKQGCFKFGCKQEVHAANPSVPSTIAPQGHLWTAGSVKVQDGADAYLWLIESATPERRGLRGEFATAGPAACLSRVRGVRRRTESSRWFDGRRTCSSRSSALAPVVMSICHQQRRSCLLEFSRRIGRFCKQFQNSTDCEIECQSNGREDSFLLFQVLYLACFSG